MERRTLAEGAWLAAFGAIAELLTGATAAISSKPDYLQVVSSHGRFPAYLVLLGALNLGLAHDLGHRSFGRGLQRGCGAMLFALALSLAVASPQLTAYATFAVIGAWLLSTALWLRPGPEWSTLQRSGLIVLLGFLGFDLLAGGPTLVLESAQARALSVINNTVHAGSLVDVLWVPVSMVVVAGTVIRGCVVERTRYDFILLGLFLVGGFMLTSIIDPLVAELVTLAPDSARAAEITKKIDLSHAITTMVVGAALWLIAAKADRRRLPVTEGAAA
jgi:hypothetical protein